MEHRERCSSTAPRAPNRSRYPPQNRRPGRRPPPNPISAATAAHPANGRPGGQPPETHRAQPPTTPPTAAPAISHLHSR
ncbi:hypothetical protein UO65_1025 [Actinokineospora spheciospongiae]|uniref:Uncharacterized protein n=1 Tax=Actinokineospora spheciospongiae TaxID=909613 RepID=W7J3L3_9PSEU|nr:hypothetical protein UO65_1025 [Actinokineospora spheciospongiae]